MRERIRAQKKEGARGHSYIMGAFEQKDCIFFNGQPLSCINKKTGAFASSLLSLLQFTDF